MFENATVALIIPALDEERVIGTVIGSLPRWLDDVIVVDNGSKDRTAEVAERGGARVVHEPRRGYGAACLAGIAALDRPDIVVFMDADGSDDPRQMERLVVPIARGESDFVIGSRALGHAEPGSMTFPQRFGNALACFLMRLLWGVRHTDLGPFRAIRFEALRCLGMSDTTYGWTVQMQIRAAKRRLRMRMREAPVDYRRRVGRSKISGTVSGTIRAGAKIVSTILRERVRRASVIATHTDDDVVPAAQDEGRNSAGACDREPRRLSIIVPTLNERGCLDETLAAIATASNAEVIVVDGGSVDGTVEIAKRRGAEVLVTAPGRARQMNAGAAKAAGDCLLFLHADTRLPRGFDGRIRRALADSSVSAGAFLLRIDAPGLSLRIIERLANARSRRLAMPYGDQGLFFRAETFHRLGGFPDVPIMEDYELMRRARRMGRVELVPDVAVTSARRWLARGVCRATLLNQLCVNAHRLGVSAERIARWRRPVDARSIGTAESRAALERSS